MKRTRILMHKPVHLGLSVLELLKIVMCEFWYDYLKPKYGEKSQLCYMDTDSFIFYIKTENICADISKDVEMRLGKNKRNISINERSVRWENNDRVCCIKSKDVQLFNRL